VSLRIRTRLTLWYVALLAAVLGALCAFLVIRLHAGLVAGVDQGLATRAAQISLGLQNRCEGEFQDVSDSSLVGLPQGESGAQLVGPDGVVRESTGDAIAEGPLLTPGQLAHVVAGGTVRATVSTGQDAEPFRLLGVRLPPGSCDGVIVVATSLEEVNRSVRELVLLLAVAVPVALAFAGIGGWWLARRALAPVGRMTEEADRIGVERLDERVDVPPSADELQHLAVTLNAMLDRLERGIDDKRRFAADASHELRTPLAVMRAELDVSLRAPDLTPGAREALSSAQEEVERMSAIVENLLTLARTDDGTLVLLRTDVGLRALADRVAAKAAPLTRPTGVQVVADGPAALVKADEARIEQVLSNLVSNAIRYSPQGGLVRIETWARDDAMGCTVTDDGPGVSPELAARIFERFVRGDPARASDGGSGLGLAISREIVAAHGGRIWVDARPGAGGSFSFSLPLEGAAAGR